MAINLIKLSELFFNGQMVMDVVIVGVLIIKTNVSRQ